tara:strand:+ start:4753 stop:5472 length:720 start_codon:yes stop_codon:yes gene_type:complete
MSGESFNNFSVFLELARRNDVGVGHENRIPLFVNDIQIATQKNVMTFGIPFSGMATGESRTLAFDTGKAEKTVNLTGILLGQTIQKRKNTENDTTTVKLTSFEMAQLIHSYVDSSALQDDQALNKLIILIPSRVDENFEYHTQSGSGDSVEDVDVGALPLIPFSWKNREYDNDFTAFTKNPKEYFTPYTDSTANSNSTSVGMVGFIRSFSTNIVGSEFPQVSFTLDFQIATVISDNPLG